MDQLRKVFVTLLIILFYLKIIIVSLFDVEEPPVILGLLMYLLCLVSIDFHRINYMMFVVLGFLFVSAFIPTARSLAFLFLFLYVMRNMSLRYIAKLNVILSVIVLICAWIGISLGEFTDQTTYQALKARNDFGFNNPNAFAVFGFGLCTNLYYLFAKNNKVITFLVIIPFAWWVGAHSGSRTFLFSIFMMLLTYFLYKKDKSQNVLFNRTLFIIAPFLLTVVVLIGALAFSNIAVVDLFFSFRLSLYKQVITQTSVFGYLFGSQLTGDITIDNSYLQLIFMGGIGGFIMFSYLYVRTMKRMPESDKWILPMFVGFLLYGTAESIMTITYMFGSMIFWLYLFQNGLRDNTEIRETDNK